MKKVIFIFSAVLAAALWATPGLAYDFNGVEIHGFISQGYVDTNGNNLFADTKDGSFEFNEFGINFSTQLTDKLRAGVQFFARDLGEIGNNEIEIDWAYADYRYQDWLGLRFGLIKTPHGLYNETRDIDMLRNWIFLPQSVYPEILRDTTLSLQGIGTYGNIDLNRMGGLSYQALYGTQNIDPNDRTAETLTGIYWEGINNDEFDVDKKVSLALVWDTPLTGLRLSGTYNRTKMEITQRFVINVPAGVISFLPFPIAKDTLFNVDYDNLENWVGSIEYTWNNLLLVAEYIETDLEYALEGTFPVGPRVINLSQDVDSKNTGWYLGGAYRFTDWFELGAYYSETDADDVVGYVFPDFYRELEDISLTARFDINMYWTFKLEYHNLEGSYGLSPWDNPDQIPGIGVDSFEEDWEIFAAKLTVAF